MTFISPGNLGHIRARRHDRGRHVCSITLNGVLLKHGIPTTSRFGDPELQNRKPMRFAEIIMYDGTSIDPLEVFIQTV
jgi:repressor of nif and glnA expression